MPDREIRDLKGDIEHHVDIDYSYLLSEPTHRIFMNQEIYRLQNEIAAYPALGTSDPTRGISDSMRGIEGYMYEYKPTARGSTWLPFFAGQVYRYIITQKEPKFVNFKRHMNDNEYVRYFKGTRILVRRLINRRNRLQAMIAVEDFVVGKDLYSFLVTDPDYDARYVLAILNSTLISYLYYTRSTTAQKDDFRQTTLEEVRQLPVASAKSSLQRRIAELVDKLVTLKKEIVDLNFKDDLRAYCHIQPISRISLSRMLRWNELRPGSDKRILDDQRRHGTISAISVTEKGDWLTLAISGKWREEGSGQEKQFSQVELLSVRLEAAHLRRFLTKVLPRARNLSAYKKYMLDTVLGVQLPAFGPNSRKNSLEIEKIVAAYEKASSKFHKMMEEMRETEAAIDGTVFVIYNISVDAANVIIESLQQDAAVGFTPEDPEVDLDRSYQDLVAKTMQKIQQS
jgi:hypothetical protein